MTKYQTIAYDSTPLNRPLSTYLVLFGLFYSPFLVAAYPLTTAGLIATLVALTVAFRLLRAYFDRKEGRSGKLSLPGIGSIEYRISR